VRDVVIGADLGTSRAKAVAYDVHGRGLFKAVADVELRTPAPGRVEQDPDALVDALAGTVRDVAGQAQRGDARVIGLALSGAMHSLLALDRAGRPLTPAITWADGRAAAQARELGRRPGAAELRRRTGTPTAAMAPLAKLCWFAQEEPELAARAARWLSVKEYLVLGLCGETVVDHSMASATGLFDLALRDWDAEALDLAAITREQLSIPVSTTAVVARLQDEAARRLGLPDGTPLVAGAADGCLENLGAGAVDEGVAAVTIGTSGAVRCVVPRPQGDPTGRLFCYALTDDRWVVGGPINNGGLVLHWAEHRLFPGLGAEAAQQGRSVYALVDELVAGVPAGAEGLVCLPALVGERAPWWDPELRGVLVGLSQGHGREHVLRALMEGVGYSLAAVADAMEQGGHPIREVQATGGFTLSPRWVEIVAGALGRPVSLPDDHEGACFGAALLGLSALDLADPLDLARQVAANDRVVRPDPADADVYRRTSAVFSGLAERLAPEFAALEDLRAAHPSAAHTGSDDT